MSFPKKHSHIPPIPSEGITQETLNAAAKAFDEHQEALYEQFAGYSADEIMKMTSEEYATRRQMYSREQYYDYHQARTVRDMSFISGALQSRIQEWSRQDPRVDQAWHLFTDRSRAGLNDTIVHSFLGVLSILLRQWDQERDQLNTRNLDNIRVLGEAANFVVSSFDDAKSRGDLDYMEACIEELDSALHDVKYGSE